MIGTLISSKTRIKLLLKFFLNSNNASHLRGLATEFAESSNSVRLELNRLEEAGMLTSAKNGNKKVYQANTQHPLYKDIRNIIMKHVGIDQIILTVIERLGSVDKVYLSGTFARGMDSAIIDLVLVGDIKIDYLTHLIAKVEKLISRRVRYLNYTSSDWTTDLLDNFEHPPLLIWENKLSVG